MNDESESRQYSLLDGMIKQELAPVRRKPEPRNNKRINTIVEVWDKSAIDAKTLAFVSRVLVQAFLPHSDPKKAGWVRRNGDFTLSVKSGFTLTEDGEHKFIGVPYGSIPRLLLAWLNSEAVSNAQDENNPNPRIINLGRSLSEFLEKIGVQRTGGVRGGITSFKKQAMRLFHAEITVNCTGENYISEQDIKITEKRFLFWDIKHQPQQPTLFESAIELSEPFYRLLTNTPVPLDWRVLKELKQSPMALDLYMWLTHRMSYLAKPTSIKWETLAKQLGADIKNIRMFRKQIRKYLPTICTIWRDLKIDDSKSDALHLFPSKSLIPQKSMFTDPALPKKKFSKTWQSLPKKQG
jgi:hypothetical protein